MATAKPKLGQQPDFNHPLMDKCILMLPFIDVSGTKVTDFSGLSHHGNFSSGSPTWSTNDGGGLIFDTTDNGGVNCGNISSSVFKGDFTTVIGGHITVLPGEFDPERFLLSKTSTFSLPLRRFSLEYVDAFTPRDGSVFVGAANHFLRNFFSTGFQQSIISRISGVMSIYKAGVFRSSYTDMSEDVSSAENLYIARHPAALIGADFEVNDIRVYEKGWTLEDVQSHFNDPWEMFSTVFSISVGGIDVTPNVSWDEPPTVTEDVTAIPVLSLGLFNRLSDTSTITTPTAFQEISVRVRGRLIFGGVITSISPARLSNVVNRFNITATGYFKTLDYVDVAREDFVSETAGFIIRSLVGKYAPWLQAPTSTVEEGVTLSQFSIRNRKLPDILNELAKDSGYVVYVTEFKVVIFTPKDNFKSSLLIADSATTYLPESLEVLPDFSRVFNVVKVSGGILKGASVTENLTGSTGLANFSLTFPVFGVDRSSLLFENFSGTIFSANFLEIDQDNSSPPPNHVSSDGYLFPEFNNLQVVGGTGTYGEVSLITKNSFQRKEFREFSCEEIFVTLVTEGIIGGITDGIGAALTDVLSGVVFKADGDLAVVIDGVEIALTQYIDTAGTTQVINPTYAISQTYSVMVHIYKTGSETGSIPWGVKLFIQGGTSPNYGTVGGRLWSELQNKQYTADPQEFVVFSPIISKTAQFVIRNARIKDPVPVTLTVAGASKNVGLETDTGSKTDAFIDINSIPNRLRFFTDTIPANGAAIVVTYDKSVDTIVRRRDESSIARIKTFSGLESDSGERHVTITPGFEVKTQEDLFRISANYLKEFSVEKFTGGVTTLTPLLTNDTNPPKIGQLLNLNLPAREIGPVDVVISQLVQTIISGNYKDSESVTSPIVEYQISFADVDTYEDFLLQTQQAKRVVLKESPNSQFVDAVALVSSLKQSDTSFVVTIIPLTNAIVGEAEVVTTLVGENSV